MKKKELAPVVVFAYNRLDKIVKCIDALEKNPLADKTELFIFSDGSKNESDRESVKDVQNWLREYTDRDDKHFAKVYTEIKNNNQGLAKSVISGVSSILSKYSKVIVVEDDIIVSPFFLNYMNDALEFYKNDDSIWSISAWGYDLKTLKRYCHDVFLGYRASSWGWATWGDRWDSVDWEVSDFNELVKSKALQRKLARGGEDLFGMLKMQMEGKIDSWAVRWVYAGLMQNKYTVYPKIGFVNNIGFDGSGVHCGIRNEDTHYIQEQYAINFERVDLDARIIKELYYIHSDTIAKKIKRNMNINGVIRMIKKKIRNA